ncbi:hypothetical protein HMPREF9176_1489 [Streptococcus downei F0415]|nr:hypothetical protein HMPREF9176_1489 [Streptococcus downei F0415]
MYKSDFASFVGLWSLGAFIILVFSSQDLALWNRTRGRFFSRFRLSGVF